VKLELLILGLVAELKETLDGELVKCW